MVRLRSQLRNYLPYRLQLRLNLSPYSGQKYSAGLAKYIYTTLLAITHLTHQTASACNSTVSGLLSQDEFTGSQEAHGKRG